MLQSHNVIIIILINIFMLVDGNYIKILYAYLIKWAKFQGSCTHSKTISPGLLQGTHKKDRGQSGELVRAGNAVGRKWSDGTGWGGQALFITCFLRLTPIWNKIFKTLMDRQQTLSPPWPQQRFIAFGREVKAKFLYYWRESRDSLYWQDIEACSFSEKVRKLFNNHRHKAEISCH